jgi:hypothetical protein
VPRAGLEPATRGLEGRADENDGRRRKARITCKHRTSEAASTSAPHCKEKRRTDVWATIGPERAARTRRARQLAGRELATAPWPRPCRTRRYMGSSLVPPAARHSQLPASVLGRRRPAAATTRCGLDDQEVHYPAADARSLHRQCRRPWLARTPLSHVARGTRLEVTRETAPFAAKHERGLSRTGAGRRE